MNKYNTLFGQLLSQVKRPDFDKICTAIKSDKFRKGFQHIRTIWRHGICTNNWSKWTAKHRKCTELSLGSTSCTNPWFYEDV